MKLFLPLKLKLEVENEIGNVTEKQLSIEIAHLRLYKGGSDLITILFFADVFVESSRSSELKTLLCKVSNELFQWTTKGKKLLQMHFE
ncbi:hypothetical protein BpHYR1_038865 [Brachionus plicatilis]|uniref:Uncharacterized protein n=1 Tax=Brachionus plicatilis TaxID=10195 RepID=A0A3M7RR48_BRAPC|nr:hypothetical protein BpHYR1_038865 [Brachionus plicatilis]